jgi:hypothetical protein
MNKQDFRIQCIITYLHSNKKHVNDLEKMWFPSIVSTLDSDQKHAFESQGKT